MNDNRITIKVFSRQNALIFDVKGSTSEYVRSTTRVKMAGCRSPAFPPSSRRYPGCNKTSYAPCITMKSYFVSLIIVSASWSLSAAFQPTRPALSVSDVKFVRPYESTTRLFESVTVAETSAEPEESGGKASVTALIFNLVKGIVGAGVLTLPAVRARFIASSILSR